MLIIPAIDIKDGKCVRLVKGEEGTETVYSHDPVSIAKKWERSGAELIHVVDLDGAFSGHPRNFELIVEIVNSVSTPVQVGGGIREIDTIKRYLEKGVKRVILGTVALKNQSFLSEANRQFPEKIAVGIDSRKGKVAVKGWKEEIDLDPKSILTQLKSVGIRIVIHTDVDRDGTMLGVNLAAVQEFVEISPIPVIASGGVSSIQDLEKLSTLSKKGLVGVILGKSLYNGNISLSEAIQRFT